MPISTGSTFALKENEITDLIGKANSGNMDAAYKLYQYYTFSRFDEKLSLEWLEAAAKLGHAIAQYNLAVHFEMTGNIEAAREWGKKSFKNGNEKAKRFLDKT